MDELKLLHEDIKEIKADVKEISRTLDKNTASLIEHSARTTVAEKRLELIETTNRWFMGLLASSVAALLAKIIFH